MKMFAKAFELLIVEERLCFQNCSFNEYLPKYAETDTDFLFVQERRPEEATY